MWVDPCVFGKCLTDTWLKCVKARKKTTAVFLRQLVSLTQPLKLSFYMSSPLPEECIVDILLRGSTFIYSS